MSLQDGARELKQAAEKASGASAAISFRTSESLTFDVIAERAEKAIRTALLWTAFNVRKSATGAIKSGGKRRFSKTYKASAPGEAPKSHVGTLKHGIYYAENPGGGFIIGAAKRGASKTPSVLEHGGVGTFKETAYDPRYVEKRRKTRRPRAKNWRGVRPKAARPYRVYAKNKQRGAIVRDYLYFYTFGAWDRARNAPEFQAWAATMKSTAVFNPPVAARPFMRPALEKQATENKMKTRLTRAFKSEER